MNLAKSYDFFKPDMCRERIHIIGCGSVGSVVAENLARFGLTKISLYDFDHVESKNIVNQMFTQEDVGKLKVHAVAEYITKINPEIEADLKVYEEGYTGQRLSGYVFLCVDNIELRKQIAESCVGNAFVKAMFDFRTRLTDAQHYAADWSVPKMIENFIARMDFSHAEAAAATPVSACNVTLSVATTIRVIVGFGVSNFINFASGKGLKQQIICDAFSFGIDAF